MTVHYRNRQEAKNPCRMEGDMKKRLCKVEEGKKIDGVCAGIAEYLNIDPTLVRLIWIGFSLAGGSGVIAYILAALVMPREDA